MRRHAGYALTALAVLLGSALAAPAAADWREACGPPEACNACDIPCTVVAVRRAEQECEGGEPSSCFRAAKAYFNGNVVPQDRTRSFDLLRSACDDEHLPACQLLGIFLVVAEGTPRDVERGMSLLGRACDAGLAGSCLQLAYVHRFYIDGPRDLAAALVRFQRACRLGVNEGCRWAADRLLPRAGSISVYEYGDDPLADRVQEATLRCERGETGHCAFAGREWMRGEAVKQDLDRAEAFLERACELDPRVYLDLGLLHARKKRPFAPERAAHWYGRGCEAGLQPACLELAVLLRGGRGGPMDPSRAAELESRGCSAGMHWGCYAFGRALVEGDGVARDEDRGLALLEGACEKKIHQACGWAAHVYLRRGQEERGAVLMDRTCENDVAWACTFAAELLQQGRGVERNPERAQRTLEKACRLEDERGCERLRAREVRGTWGE